MYLFIEIRMSQIPEILSILKFKKTEKQMNLLVVEEWRVLTFSCDGFAKRNFDAIKFLKLEKEEIEGQNPYKSPRILTCLINSWKSPSEHSQESCGSKNPNIQCEVYIAPQINSLGRLSLEYWGIAARISKPSS